MKIIDHTPFREEDGTISIVGRAQGVLKYGLNWSSILDGQDIVIAIFQKHLGAKFTLLRNVVLPGTDDVRLPLVLAGPSGVFLLNVSQVRGVYRAKGGEWGTISGSTFKPSNPNLLARTSRFGQGLQKFLNKQGFNGSVNVESILLATNPGLHADSVRPIVRVVLSDALERLAVSLSQAVQVITPDTAESVIDRIINPKPVKAAQTAPPKPRENPINDPYAIKEPEKKSTNPTPATRAIAASVRSATDSAPKGMTSTGKKTAKSGINLSTKQLVLIAGIFGFLVICFVVLIITALFMNVP